MRDLPYDESPTNLPGTEFTIPLAKFRAIGQVSVSDWDEILNRVAVLRTRISNFSGPLTTRISALPVDTKNRILAVYEAFLQSPEWGYLDPSFTLEAGSNAISVLETKWADLEEYVAYQVQMPQVAVPVPVSATAPATTYTSSGKALFWLFALGISAVGLLSLGLSFWKPAHAPGRRSHA